MTVEGAITAAGNILPDAMDAIGRMFPGIAMGSADRAKSRSTKRALKDMEIVKSIGVDKGMSQESIDALCSAIAKERMGCERLSNVVRFAAEMDPDAAKADEIDPSWIEAFRDYAEHAVDETAQRTWAAILAGEMERPGSVSRRTMSILNSMGRSEAEAFRKICGLTTHFLPAVDKGNAPDSLMIALSLDENYRSYNCGEVTVDEIGVLDSLGLIDKGLVANFPIGPNVSARFYAAAGTVRVSNRSSEVREIEFREAAFLPPGIELAKICGVGESPFLQDALLELTRKEGFDAEIESRLL